MTVALTGGMPAATDLVTAVAPNDPARREGASMWIWDDAGRFGLPRIAVDAIGATWDSSRLIGLNLAFPDGRVLVAHGEEEPHSPTGADGLARVLGGGPLRLECVEPFAAWRLTFDGRAVETTVEEQLAGDRAPRSDAPTRTMDLFVEVHARMAVPPWVQGTLEPEGHFVLGEERFEQLFSAEGLMRVDGNEVAFSGGGLRIHRKGGKRSDYSDWFGHCWQSTRFPSGRAFGYIHYAPRPDGSVKYHEGYIYEGDELIPARVVDTPWMTKMQPSGQDASFTLQSARGRADIEVETFVSTFVSALETDGQSFPPLQQGIARYRWDGEEAYGMIERSYPRAMMHD